MWKHFVKWKGILEYDLLLLGIKWVQAYKAPRKLDCTKSQIWVISIIIINFYNHPTKWWVLHIFNSCSGFTNPQKLQIFLCKKTALRDKGQEMGWRQRHQWNLRSHRGFTLSSNINLSPGATQRSPEIQEGPFHKNQQRNQHLHISC